MRILMIEDEAMMAKAVAEVLRKQNYLVDLAEEGDMGLDLGLSDVYDVIVLDVMLPGMDGLTVLKKLRRNQISVPIIILTARSQIEDRVRGLDLGADDYLTKPFHTDELLARIRALSRREPDWEPGDVLRLGDFIFTSRTFTVQCGQREIKLTPKESHLLEYLIKNKSGVVSKDMILEKIWGYDSDAEYNHVEAHISQLRKKLKQAGSKSTIRTVWGVGYTMNGAV